MAASIPGVHTLNYDQFSVLCANTRLTNVCTQDGELIAIEWKVQQDATI
jgi:hypothetical protein